MREFFKVGRIVYDWARRIHADIIVCSFAHLRTALRTEGNMLDVNLVQAGSGSEA